MGPGDIDGGTPPTEITSKDPHLPRPGPVPLAGDSWDLHSGAWLSTDSSVGGSDRYQGQRRTKGTGSGYRWWIGGAAALIASVAAGALIMTPPSGADGPTSASSRPNTQSTDELASTTGALPPVGGSSAPVGQATAAGGNQPFSVSIEAESGSPMVVLIGSAVVESDERASGGQIVTKLGNSGTGAEPGALRIGGISVPSGGTYRISIHYANLDDTHSSAVFSVTGAEPTTLNFAGNRKCCGVRTIDVTLAAGAHVLTITNATGPAPSIDKIVVSRA